MEPLRPNAQRARTAITLIWIVMALDAAMLFSAMLEYNLLSSWQAGAEISSEAAEANDARQMVLALLRTAAFIVSAVTFVRWFRRAYFNLGKRVSHLKESEGMAAGAWFIPIINLFKPYRIMMELHERTAELVAPLAPDPERARSKDHITVWWIFWVASNVLGQVVFRVGQNANTIDELANSSVISMIDAALSIPLAILAVLVVKRYAALEPFLESWRTPVDAFEEAGHRP